MLRLLCLNKKLALILNRKVGIAHPTTAAIAVIKPTEELKCCDYYV